MHLAGSDWFNVIFYGGLAMAGVCAIYIGYQKSKRKLLAFAERNGLKVLGNILPGDLPIALTDQIDPFLRVRRCVSGVRYGERVISFEYIRTGRSQQTGFSGGSNNTLVWLTAVAVLQQHPQHPPIPRRLERVNLMDGWVLATVVGGNDYMLTEQEIVDEWDALSTTGLSPTHHEDTGVFIAPRHEQQPGFRQRHDL